MWVCGLKQTIRFRFLYGIVKQNLLQETVAVSPLYGVFTPMTFGLGYFLHTYFQSAICARNYLLPIVQKGAKNTINITNDTFISSKLYLPLDVEEQASRHSGHQQEKDQLCQLFQKFLHDYPPCIFLF